MLRLVEPAPTYKAAILDAVTEMQAVGEWDISPDAFEARFDDMLRRGENAPGTLGEVGVEILDFQIRHGCHDARSGPIGTGKRG